MVVAVGGRDEFGNPVTVGGVQLEAQIKIQPHAASRQAPVAYKLEVLDRQNGTFEVAHHMKLAGDFAVRPACGLPEVEV